MVIHAFPIFKLGALLVRQISKPIANVVKDQAKSSPVFRRYVCLPPARFYNWCEVRTKMWLLKLGQPVNITVLNEKDSIELGANLLGEGVIFIIASGILIAEYARSSSKEAAKEEAKKKEMAELQSALRDLFVQTEEQGAHIRELTRKVGELETRTPSQHRFNDRDDTSSPPRRDPPAFVPQIDEQPEAKVSSTDVPATGDVDSMESSLNSSPLPKGVIFKAIKNVENQFFYPPEADKQTGILVLALKHLYEDVYRIPF